MKKSDFQVVAVVAVFAAMLIALMYIGPRYGLPVGIAEDFEQLSPGLSGVVIGMLITAYVTGRSGGLFALPAFFMVGWISSAYLFGPAHDMGLITTQMLSGLTIDQLKLCIVAVSTLMGGGITAIAYSRRY